MHECDYCSASFDDEDTYYEHLDAEHGDEMGRIDRRRVDAAVGDGDGGIPTPYLLAAAGVGVVGLALVGLVFVLMGGGGQDATPEGLSDVTVDGVESRPLPDSGNTSALSAVETFPRPDSTQHVSGSVDYDEVPPVSGPHHGGTIEAGFYRDTPSLERMVHSLEHGAVVIYYDSGALTDVAERSLMEWAKGHQGHWSSVIVAPNLNDDPAADYVLTAWRAKLEMDGYDPAVVQAFLAEYLGRGPENPVR